MSNLFLIDGVPGSGKSDLLQYCARDGGTFLIKPTTKQVDLNKREDLMYVSEEEFNSMVTDDDFVYKYPEASNIRYLIKRSTLDEKLRKYNNVFVIVRSSDVISAIKKVYSRYYNVKVVSIFLYCDNEQLKNRTIKQETEKKEINDNRLKRIKSAVNAVTKGENVADDYSKEELEIIHEVEKRLNRNNECLRSYITSLRTSEKYDYVLINDLNIDTFHICIDNIIRKYNVNNTKNKQLSAFVIMPMPDNHEGAHFYRVKEAIYAGAKRAGFEALRQDDKQYEQKMIYQSIKEAIQDATICIVDLTNTRPNCYFEAGLAFAKENSNIPTAFLIAEKDTKIEFDLSGVTCNSYVYRPNDYSNIETTVEDLLKKFKEEYIL